MNCYFNKKRRKIKDTWWILAKKLVLLVDSSDLQLCIIGSQLYKSALLHSTFLRTWYISKKLHLNVTLKACCAEDHSKCQNSLMRPMTEFRISLHHVFLKWISNTVMHLEFGFSSVLLSSLLAFKSSGFCQFTLVSRLNALGKSSEQWYNAMHS